MKDIITRPLDEMGRIVFPAGIRKSLKWKEKDDIMIILKEDGVFLKKRL